MMRDPQLDRETVVVTAGKPTRSLTSQVDPQDQKSLVTK